MRFLLRHSTKKPDGSIEHRDVEFSGDEVSIGRAVDQIVQVTGAGVASEHAVIGQKSAGNYQIRALTGAGVTVNDATVRSATLRVGDVISVGASRLSAIKPPFGFDFALEFSHAAAGAEPNPYAHFPTQLEQTRLKKRRWSWALGVGFFLFGFLLPLAGALFGPVQSALQAGFLPSDHAWLAGPLQPAHRVPQIQNNCQVCHSSVFRRVKNEQCLDCHEKDAGNHVNPKQHRVAELEGARCSACHVEHNEPTGAVHAKQQLCSRCHSAIGSTIDSPAIENAADFGTIHPPFKLTLLTPTTATADTDWQPVRNRVTPDLREISNLKFPHDKHLNKEGVRRPDGEKEPLACADCHQLDSAGQYIQPITMEQHCRRCHALTFDADDPQRELPHGDPNLIMQTLEEYYSRKYLEQSLAPETPATVSGRRRPGRQALTAEQREQVLELARDKALEVATPLFEEPTAQAMSKETAELIFEKTTCATCHQVSASDDAARLAKWRVLPVKLTQRWMPRAVFSHYSHRTEDCERCHAAEKSQDSTDILLPAIETCRECHSGQRGSGVPSTCIACHKFHVMKDSPMR
jgi:hypothetical protein